jgi:multiple sugar transport system permease protein
MNAPAVAIILVLIAYPLADAFWTSLHRFNLKRPNVFPFVGLQNYVDLVTGEQFLHSLSVTMTFTVLAVSLVMALGLGLAVLLNERFVGRALLRSLLLIPWAIPPVASGMMWRWILDGKVGAFNGVLAALGISHAYFGWLSNPDTALLAIVGAHVWNTMPLAGLVLLAALQSVPHELYDAAKVDGASVLGRFKAVTLPWLVQPLMTVLILETLLAFRVFDLVYVLTSGGPGDATTVLSWLTYQTAFTYLDLGRGNAYAFLMALAVGLLTVVYIRLLARRGSF